MSISGVNGVFGAFNAVNNIETNNQKNSAQFKECVENEMQKGKLVFPEGKDIVMGFPPAYYTKYDVDSSKSREEMTLDEYKQYICNVVSSLPVSASVRTNCSGALIFKEEAFVNMKNDPEYEKTIINMLREGFSVQYPFYAPNVGYQVIGGTAEACYGESIPVNSSSGTSFFSGDEKSWWQKQHEKMEEVLKEQVLKAQQKETEQRKAEQKNWLNSQLDSQQKLQISLLERSQSGQETLDARAFNAIALSAYGVPAYKDNIKKLSI